MPHYVISVQRSVSVHNAGAEESPQSPPLPRAPFPATALVIASYALESRNSADGRRLVLCPLAWDWDVIAVQVRVRTNTDSVRLE